MINSEGKKDILSSKLCINCVFHCGHPAEVQQDQDSMTKMSHVTMLTKGYYWIVSNCGLQSSVQENKFYKHPMYRIQSSLSSALALAKIKTCCLFLLVKFETYNGIWMFRSCS